MRAQGSGSKPKLGEILLQQGKITQKQLDEALQEEAGERKIGQVLVDLGYVRSQDIVLKAWAGQLGIKFVDLDEEEIDEDVAKVIPVSVLERYNVLAIRMSGNCLTVAMVDPTNVFALDDIRLITGYEINPVLATPEQIKKKLQELSDDNERVPLEKIGKALEELEGPSDVSEGAGADGTESSSTEESPIERIANTAIQVAIHRGASNITVVPDRRGVTVLYQIDGEWHEVMHLPRYVYPPLVVRFKVMAGCNPAERRLIQEGVISVRIEGKDIVLDAKFFSTSEGEVVCLRPRPLAGKIATFEKMGLSPQIAKELFLALRDRRGVTLFFGEDYAVVKGLLYAGIKVVGDARPPGSPILTAIVEKRITAKIPGVMQIGINLRAGLNCSNILRGLWDVGLDVLAVEQILDLSAASHVLQIPVKRVLAGMAIDESERVLESLMRRGVEPWLLSGQLSALVGCRMARKVCPDCAIEQPVPRRQLERIGLLRPEEGGDPETTILLRDGAGCASCHHTGYFGQTGIFELVLADSQFCEILARFPDCSAEEKQEAILRATVCSFADDALAKLRSGQISLREATRVLARIPG